MTDDPISDSDRDAFGITKLEDAIEAFANAASAVAESLRTLPIAKDVVSWLEEEPDKFVEEIESLLKSCNDDADSLLELLDETLKHEPAEDLSELLEIADDVSDLVDNVLAGRASDDLAEELNDYIQKQLEPFTEAGWKLYYVLLGAD